MSVGAAFKSFQYDENESNSSPSSSNTMRNQIFVDYAPLIMFIAQAMRKRLTKNVDLDDLFSSGMIGLLKAIDQYDPSRNAKFKSYAEHCIRWEMLDFLRHQDWLPRSIRFVSNNLKQAHSELTKYLGREPSSGEISDYLEIPLAAYYSFLARAQITVVTFEEGSGSDLSMKEELISDLESCIEHSFEVNQVEILIESQFTKHSPDNMIVAKNERDLIFKAVEMLPERLKLVLSLYYYEDLNLQEIGRILGLTESRISQIHSQAIRMLRANLAQLDPEDYRFDL